MAARIPRSPFHRLIRAVVVLVLILVIGVSAAITMRDRIVAMVLDVAEARLAERGLYVKRTSHELSWRRGVVLNELSLYGDKERQKQVARLGNFGVWISLLDLFRANPTVVFSSDRSDLTLNTSAGELQLRLVDFHLTSREDSLAIDKLDSRLKGLRITAGGMLRWAAGDKSQKFVVPDLAPLVKAASWLDFPQGTPTLALQIHSDEASPDDVNLRGVLTGTNFRWKQLSLEKADVRFELEPASLKIPAMSLDCYGGNLSGALTIDYQRNELIVTKIVSTVEPFRFVSAILNTDSMDSCRSVGQTVMSGENITFDLEVFARSRGAFLVSAPQGLAIMAGSREILLGDFHSTLKFAGGNLVLDGSEFTIHGGKGAGSYTMPLSSPYQYRLKVETNDVSLAELGREFGLKGDLAGRLSAAFTGGGASGMESHYGSGRVSVTDGKFYSVPIFGSLRAMLVDKSPRFGVDEARDLYASLSLKEGIVSSSDFRIENVATMLSAKGRIDMVHQTLDVDVLARLKRVVGIATEIVSRVFEIHGEGPLDDVHWSMANSPRIVKDVTHTAIEGVEAVTGETGNVIEDVGDGVFKLFEDRPRFFTPKKESPAPRK